MFCQQDELGRDRFRLASDGPVAHQDFIGDPLNPIISPAGTNRANGGVLRVLHDSISPADTQ
jgi:hypothetical protein